jgi:Pyridoxamine 5'-phosphate oxidase
MKKKKMMMTSLIVLEYKGYSLIFKICSHVHGFLLFSVVNIDKNSNTILVNTAKGRIKYRNISRDPRVAVSVIDFSNPYHMVTDCKRKSH